MVRKTEERGKNLKLSLQAVLCVVLFKYDEI